MNKKDTIEFISIENLLHDRISRVTSFLTYQNLKKISERNEEFKLKKYKRQLQLQNNVSFIQEEKNLRAIATTSVGKIDMYMKQQNKVSNVSKRNSKRSSVIATGPEKMVNNTSVQTIISSSHLDISNKYAFYDVFKLECFKVDNALTKLIQYFEDILKQNDQDIDKVNEGVETTSRTTMKKSTKAIRRGGVIKKKNPLEEAISFGIKLIKNLAGDQIKVKQMLKTIIHKNENILNENDLLQDKFETLLENKNVYIHELQNFIDENQAKYKSKEENEIFDFLSNLVKRDEENTFIGIYIITIIN